MNDLDFVKKSVFCCTMSLAKAIQDAGGCIPSASELDKMTVQEFVAQIAAMNNIRFIHDSRKE